LSIFCRTSDQRQHKGKKQ